MGERSVLGIFRCQEWASTRFPKTPRDLDTRHRGLAIISVHRLLIQPSAASKDFFSLGVATCNIPFSTDEAAFPHSAKYRATQRLRKSFLNPQIFSSRYLQVHFTYLHCALPQSEDSVVGRTETPLRRLTKTESIVRQTWAAQFGPFFRRFVAGQPQRISSQPFAA